MMDGQTILYSIEIICILALIFFMIIELDKEENYD